MLNSCEPMDCSPPTLLCPWDFPGKNTGMDCLFLLQGIILTQGLNSSLLHWQTDSLPLSHQGSPLLDMPNVIWGLRIQIKIRCSTLLLICLSLKRKDEMSLWHMGMAINDRASLWNLRAENHHRWLPGSSCWSSCVWKSLGGQVGRHRSGRAPPRNISHLDKGVEEERW